MTLFEGLSAFPITPADPDGRVAPDDLAVLLNRIVEAGADSIGLLGSTGTYAYLTRAERARTIRAAVDIVAGRVPLIVGIGALRTDDAQDLARDAAAAGADGLLLAPVSYTPLTDDDVFQHFVAVAAATDRPLCVYNNPSTTHFNFSEDLLVRLAGVPHIAAVKNPGLPAAEVSGQLDGLRGRLPAHFAIGYSGDWYAAGALLAGADAWYSVVAGLLPRPALALLRAAQAGDAAETGRLDAALLPLWELFKAFGSLRVIYAAANICGITSRQPPRPILPMHAPDQKRVADVIAALSTSGLV